MRPMLPQDVDRGVTGLRSTSLQHRLSALMPWLVTAIATALLYFGRSVLMPIALAILLSFLLSPVVAGFRRLRLPKSWSVMLAILLALTGVVLTSAVIVSQVSILADDAPVYAQRVSAKLDAARAGIRKRFSLPIRDAASGKHRPTTVERAESTANRRSPGTAVQDVIPVEVHNPPASALDELKSVILPALAPVETAVIVLAVTIFILFQKEDLRDRLIRLMGTADLHRTTVALDDAAKRLSRYFLAQTLVNGTFGGVIWAGLFMLGIPAPALWGLLAGLLRFIPYVGVLISAAVPIALAAAVAPGFGLALSVLGLFLIVEPIVGYAIEPMIYGHSTGLSPVSVVIAAIFWTWIWGPVGLVLAMPLTLILVVMGRHIPAFEVFDVLLGDRPALTPAETFYQRALAMRPDDAIEHAEEQLEQMPLLRFYDEIGLAGLRLAAADVARGAVERPAMTAVCDTVLELVGALADHRTLPEDAASIHEGGGENGTSNLCSGRTIVCLSGRGPLDRAVSAMAVQLLEQAGARALGLAGEGLQLPLAVEPATVDAVCILGLLDQRAFKRFRPLSQSLKERFPGAMILIGIDRSPQPDQPEPGDRQRLLASFTELLNQIASTPPRANGGAP